MNRLLNARSWQKTLGAFCILDACLALKLEPAEGVVFVFEADAAFGAACLVLAASLSLSRHLASIELSCLGIQVQALLLVKPAAPGVRQGGCDFCHPILARQQPRLTTEPQRM